ncbi:MAG: RecX family transcriptional regulator [Flavipsychrobacter sp.]|nr:RecX family transcriptional regulator [Flavipsychrobacter sp.]
MIDPAILHYCKYQERCHSEVRNKLYELGFGKTDVEYQISELISAGVLNEERFARAFARGKWRMLKWGRVKITQQLKAKKVSDYCIKKGLSEIDGEEYEAILMKIAEKKAEELKKERNIRAKMAKMHRFLLQKGYEQDLVKYALEIALKQN